MKSIKLSIKIFQNSQFNNGFQVSRFRASARSSPINIQIGKPDRPISHHRKPSSSERSDLQIPIQTHHYHLQHLGLIKRHHESARTRHDKTATSNTINGPENRNNITEPIKKRESATWKRSISFRRRRESKSFATIGPRPQ